MLNQLSGPYVGHFSNMLAEMLQSDCLSILQVRGVNFSLLHNLHVSSLDQGSRCTGIVLAW